VLAGALADFASRGADKPASLHRSKSDRRTASVLAPRVAGVQPFAICCAAQIASDYNSEAIGAARPPDPGRSI
jgi:hypothetical protein